MSYVSKAPAGILPGVIILAQRNKGEGNTELVKGNNPVPTKLYLL